MAKTNLFRIISGVVIVSILAPSISMAAGAESAQQKHMEEAIQMINDKMNKKFNEMSPEKQMRVLKNTQHKLQKLETNLSAMSDEDFSKKEEKIKKKLSSLIENNNVTAEEVTNDGQATLEEGDAELAQDFSELSNDINADQLTHESGTVDPVSFQLDKEKILELVHNSKAEFEKEIQDRGGKVRNPASVTKFLNWALPIALVGVLAVTGQLVIFLAFAVMGSAVFFLMIGVILLIQNMSMHGTFHRSHRHYRRR